jgi:hypothetical protein
MLTKKIPQIKIRARLAGLQLSEAVPVSMRLPAAPVIAQH